ncbi:5,6-dimethylbenzimidazole synthase [Candidatus Terasakiella magnetica]|uniref:5,6-dimethylbenzimidazole synthase n=1 Tax=Candidatus Terasakiella magnetica TaxID=1867952 RepID=A0A1C3RDZ7_9PROT|nr:5,6-dimethylbenzimidazole synthase [Candidatus Terasakiella magnetica]SCA55513.1 5,6-dimethylbenzimidazole synthase [Candidatus Terasakiella magnetica]
MPTPPVFDSDFQKQLDELFKWRRDVRHFKTDPLPDGLLEEFLETATLAPSVGNSQPWRFVIVEDQACKKAIRDNFEACNKEAMQDYDGEKAQTYASLKLSGLDRAPAQVAVFCDSATDVGQGLGQKTMPETLKYSVVSSIQTLWLSARAQGVGIGWVSIIEPEAIKDILDIKEESWDLVAYLCIGYPEEEHDVPELVRFGWQDRLPLSQTVLKR